MEGKIRIAGTVGESIVDGPGFRYTLFVQGCPHGWPGCHNPQTHDFEGGQDIELDTLLKDMCRNPFIKGVTFSGGEPFCKAEPLYHLAVELKRKGKHLMAYSGYTFEQLLELSDPFVKKLLGQLDLLVDGPFIMAEKNIELRFRGSANQRVLDVPKSLEANEAVWAEMAFPVIVRIQDKKKFMIEMSPPAEKQLPMPSPRCREAASIRPGLQLTSPHKV